jgi:hypothetical protein
MLRTRVLSGSAAVNVAEIPGIVRFDRLAAAAAVDATGLDLPLPATPGWSCETRSTYCSSTSARRVARVQLHADLTMLARLAQAA